MSSRASLWISLLVCGVGLGVLQAAAALSEQQADAFSRKMAIITQQGSETSTKGAAKGPRRTSFSEAELNSWFTYRSQEVLPQGVSEPRVTIVGDGKLKAAATVDLDSIAKQKSGGALNPWSYLGGRLPVTVSGVLRTQDGMGRFDLEEAAVSGVPIPKSIMQEIVAYYSKTDDAPAGVRLDDGFKLPAKIQQIEVGQGQAVVVQ